MVYVVAMVTGRRKAEKEPVKTNFSLGVPRK